MEWKCDVLVIGTGTAAYQVIQACAAAGLETIVIDERAYGGTCARRGCQPKKILFTAAETVTLGRQLEGRGIAEPAALNWPELIASKREFTDAVPGRTERGFRDLGVTTLHGSASFVGPDRVAVDGPDRGEVSTRVTVVATGAVPAPLPIEGAEHLTTSEQFLELESLPRRVICVGGGFVSAEFGHIAAAAGAEVTILHRGSRLLARFDADLADGLTAATRARGIDVQTGVSVESVRRIDGEFVVGTDDGRIWRADLVLHGAGRVAAVESLDLAAAGVKSGPDGIEVDEAQRSTTNPAVFAIGDVVAGSPKLAPVADHEGQVAAANIIGGESYRVVERRSIPSVVFTVPALAAVGLDEQEARRTVGKIEVRDGDAAGWATSRHLGQRIARFKLITDAADGRIVGAHFLGHGAGDLINLFALAMWRGVGLEELATVPWAYPTVTSDIKYIVAAEPRS